MAASNSLRNALRDAEEGVRRRRSLHHNDDNEIMDSDASGNLSLPSANENRGTVRAEAGTPSGSSVEAGTSAGNSRGTAMVPDLTIDINAARSVNDTQSGPLWQKSPAHVTFLAPSRANTLPPDINAPVSRSSTLPLSPRTRNRGYSLRRTLFARTLEDQTSDGEVIELGEAGPSTQHPPPRSFHDTTGTEDGEKPEKISVSPVVEEVPLTRPKSQKKSFGTITLPNYDVWAQHSKRSGLVQTVREAYKAARRFALRIQEIPPSKDGRHVYLDASRKKPLIDERTGKEYIINTIRSSRYTAYNFVPKQIIFQFSKLANFYFLCVSILQMIPGLSTTGTYTTIIPLLIFVSISMGKEGYDDYRRYKLDEVENNKSTSVLHAYQPVSTEVEGDGVISIPTAGPKHWAPLKWKNIKVGDIVRIERDDEVPADIVLLHADGPNGIAYIETMALDGETNLKCKQASPALAKRCEELEGIVSCDALLVCEDPNADLYNFEGKVSVDDETLPLTSNEVVYRGSKLRNTNEAIGMVINTGEECKIRMNANKNPRIKAPSLQTIVNRVVVIIVIFVIALAIFNTVAYQFWSKQVEEKSWYLKDASVAFIPIFVSFIVMFNTMIPLSLYVSMEIIKVGQMLLMNDINMYDPVSDTPMEARTTTINEELGQISYVFSDKTGTLTDNTMQFRKMSVAGYAWLHDADLEREEIEKARRREAEERRRKRKGKGKDKSVGRQKSRNSISHRLDSEEARDSVTMDENEPRGSGLGRNSSQISRWKSTARPAKAQLEHRTEELLNFLQHKPHSMFAKKARFFLLSLALCHTCLPEVQENGRIDFQAASPDELALVRAAQDLGYLVVDRASQTITIKSSSHAQTVARQSMSNDLAPPPDLEETYEVLDVIEFSSKRKRMSIVVRFPNGRICIFCKGADSIVMQRLKNASMALQKATEIDRKESMRKSVEAEQALRRMSEQSPRNSMSRPSFSLNRASINLGRKSTGGAGRPSMASNKLQPIRDEVNAWLKNREHDSDMSTVDRADAYRNSFASSHGDGSRMGDDEYYDEMIDEAIVLSDSAVLERTFQHINDFATEGLRTLMYACRFLDDDEYHQWTKLYSDATTSLVNRQEMIEQAGDMIEQNLDLVGATAIEDKLQDGVPDTIDKLRRANIKIWVLTGDKRETAINVGSAARVIKHFSSITVLDHEVGDVEQKMATTLLEINAGRVAHSVVVTDGQTLAGIETNETLAILFFDLVVQADSVICCRASPSQKALLVKKIRTKVKHAITLAIGDGANDIAMIQEAHVGIGITGKEGLQAARTSDYSIAQFRFLQRLLLVHGRWNYVRTGKYVLSTFWKELMFYLTTALYQHWAGYTGTSFYESASLSMFNTLFTSLPVIFIGVFEQDLKAETLLAVPELYTHGQKNMAFNIKKYLAWVFMAACEAMIIYFIVLTLFGETVFTRDNGLFAMGQLSFSACVIFINTKILILEMHNKTLVSAIGWVLSIGGWFIFNLLIGALEKSSAPYYVKNAFIQRFGDNLLWWLVLILIVSCVCVFETIESAFRQLLFPTDVDTFRALEKDEVLNKRFADAAEGIGMSNVQSAEKASVEEEEEREREVRELLARPRVMDQTAETGELHRRHISSDVLKTQGAKSTRASVDVHEVSPLKLLR